MLKLRVSTAPAWRPGWLPRGSPPATTLVRDPSAAAKSAGGKSSGAAPARCQSMMVRPDSIGGGVASLGGRKPRLRLPI